MHEPPIETLDTPPGTTARAGDSDDAVTPVEADIHPAGLVETPREPLEMAGALDADQPSEPTDGRTLRKLRNRQAVMDAVLDLIDEGVTRPTIGDIAQRANVSDRSIFRYFDDLADLVRSSIEYGVERAEAMSRIPDIGEGPLEHRIATYCESRIMLFTATQQLGRTARNQSDSIRALTVAVRRAYGIMESQAAAQFEPELSALDPDDASLLLDAIGVLTGFGAYDTQNSILEQDDERIHAIWSHSLKILLAA